MHKSNFKKIFKIRFDENKHLKLLFNVNKIKALVETGVINLSIYRSFLFH